MDSLTLITEDLQFSVLWQTTLYTDELLVKMKELGASMVRILAAERKQQRRVLARVKRRQQMSAKAQLVVPEPKPILEDPSSLKEEDELQL